MRKRTFVYASLIGAAVVPATSFVGNMILLRSRYHPTNLLIIHAVFSTIVIAVTATGAFLDWSSAVRRNIHVRRTQRAVMSSFAAIVVVLSAAGFSIENASNAGGAGSSTNTVALFVIPIFALIFGVITYTVVWLGAGALAAISRALRRP